MKLQINFPVSNFKDFIINLARANNINYIKTGCDELAVNFTRLSDDEVVFDDIENLIIALERAGIIASKDVVPLHISYLREINNN